MIIANMGTQKFPKMHSLQTSRVYTVLLRYVPLLLFETLSPHISKLLKSLVHYFHIFNLLGTWHVFSNCVYMFRCLLFSFIQLISPCLLSRLSARHDSSPSCVCTCTRLCSLGSGTRKAPRHLFLTHTTKSRLGTGVLFLPVYPVMEDAAHLFLGWNFIPWN